MSSDAVTTTSWLGPLTTVFTPPTGCLATATYNPSAIWAPDYSKSLSPAVLYGATGQGPDLVCYPSKYKVNQYVYPWNIRSGWLYACVYSPGVCPSGWTSACAPTSDDFTFFTGSVTGVQCCPSGFRCSDYWWCVNGPTPTAMPVWSVWEDKWGIDGVLTESAFPNMKGMAKPIFVAYEASDQELLSSVAANNSTLSPTAAAGDSLSGGAIAGIAIGAAAGGILAALLFFLSLVYCLGFRFRRERGGLTASESHHELAAKEAASQPASRRKSGSPQWSATELPSTRQNPVDNATELDTSATYGRSELAGAREYKA